MASPTGNRRASARRGGAVYRSGGDGGLGPLLRTVGMIVLVILALVLIAKNCTGGETEAANLVKEVELQLALEEQASGNATAFDGVVVSATDKTVTLAGQVATNADKLSAHAAAVRTAGVDEVIDEIAITEAAAAPNSGAAGGLQTQLAEMVSSEPIQFTVGSAELEDSSKATLDRVAQAITASGRGSIIEIRGYTDSQGDDGENQILSQERADTVRQYLVDREVDGIMLSSVGLGGESPIADNETEEGRAQNRRIEFVVT